MVKTFIIRLYKAGEVLFNVGGGEFKLFVERRGEKSAGATRAQGRQERPAIAPDS